MIKNENKKTILVRKQKTCKSVLSKSIGFMFGKKPKDYGLIFVFNNEELVPLHMLFVTFPLDVLWLDSKKQVVESATLKPWILNYSPKHKARYVLELPKGTIRKSKTKIGDRIKF